MDAGCAISRRYLVGVEDVFLSEDKLSIKRHGYFGGDDDYMGSPCIVGKNPKKSRLYMGFKVF